VIEGTVRCGEARELLLWFVNAQNPCIDAGNTCQLRRGEWTCSAPSAGSYPVMYRCESRGGSFVAEDAVGPSVRGPVRKCGNPPGVDVPGPFDVKTNITCDEAFDVANHGVSRAGDPDDECGGKAGASSCRVDGFECVSRNTGYESSETRCTWDQRRVTFETGS
jgi:hypothetical protein